MGAGHFLRSLFDETEKKAQEHQDKFDKERQADIDMYRKVLLDPNSSPEQRTKAASEIEKLRNIKGKQGPFSNLANILNTIKGHHSKMQAPPSQNQEEIPNAGGGGIPQGQTPRNLPAERTGGRLTDLLNRDPNDRVLGMQPPPSSSVGSAKQNVAQRAFDKVGKGLGVATGIIDRALTGQGGKQPSLPPMDASAFNYPSPAQQQQAAHINEFKQFTDDFEQAFKRKPTQTEIDTYFHLAPNPKNPVIKVADDPNSPTGRSYVATDPQTGQEVWRQQNAPKPPSEEPRDTTTTSTDPYGGTTTTKTHRELTKDKNKKTMKPPPSKNGQGDLSVPRARGGMKPPPSSQTSSISQPSAIAGQSTGTAKGGYEAFRGATKASDYGLTVNYQIPPSVAANPRVREAANELLDGMDVTKINPPSLRSGAAMLARQFGWEQGKFTPKEQVMLKEASTFLEEAASNPSVRVLDQGFVERYKLQQAMKNPDKEGFIGRGFSLAAAQNLSPSQQEFVRMYNQLVGTISGLSQLVRSGRATEATIERLKSELPNPVTTSNSADAKARIQRLLNEISVALDKGSFTGLSQAQPKTQSSPKLDPSVKRTLENNGIRVPQ